MTAPANQQSSGSRSDGLVERDSGIALHAQISRALADEIRMRYRPSEHLLAEARLATRFGVNRHTLRRAIEALIAQGLVQRRHGVGTIVLDPPVASALGGRTRFTENLLAVSRHPGSEVIRRGVIEADATVSEHLGVAEGADILWLETLRRVDGKLFALIGHHLPIELAAAVDAYRGGPLHAHLERRLGISILRRSTFISTMLPSADDAAALLIPRTQPVLRITGVNVDGAGRVIECALSRVRGDRVQLSVEHAVLA